MLAMGVSLPVFLPIPENCIDPQVLSLLIYIFSPFQAQIQGGPWQCRKYSWGLQKAVWESRSLSYSLFNDEYFASASFFICLPSLLFSPSLEQKQPKGSPAAFQEQELTETCASVSVKWILKTKHDTKGRNLSSGSLKTPCVKMTSSPQDRSMSCT